MIINSLRKLFKNEKTIADDSTEQPIQENVIESEVRKFDLNIGKILENWEPCHAIREFIANALDEQYLSKSTPFKIYKEGNKWHIRDFGRGIQYFNFTQNENEEKLSNPIVIGKFGIGLKDALATLYRNGAIVEIKSKFGIFKIDISQKNGFSDISTLHIFIEPNINNDFVGTDISISGINDSDVYEAKNLFMIFNQHEVYETTRYGQILSKKGSGFIYINGVKVAEEDNFIFSYNITNISNAIKKAINRERTNVGRSAYTETIKKMLLNSHNEIVLNTLKEDLQNLETGICNDEMKWLDVQEYVVKLLNIDDNILFLSSEQIIKNPELIEEATNIGKQIVTLPSNLIDRIENGLDFNGNSINVLTKFAKDINDNFDYSFIPYEKLSNNEQTIFNSIPLLLKISGINDINEREVCIASELQKNCDYYEVKGICTKDKIIIKRSCLKSMAEFAGIFLHEAIHAKFECSDISRDFENQLSRILGITAANICKEINDKD